MAEKHLYGLTGVKFGTPTDLATMPAVLAAFSQTVKGSFTFAETEATIEKFYTEESASAVEAITTVDPQLEATWKTYDFTPAMLEKVKGGDGHTTATQFIGPTATPDIKLAVELSTTSGITWSLYKCNVTARFTGKLSKEGLSEVEIKVQALAPAAGLAAYDYDYTP